MIRTCLYACILVTVAAWPSQAQAEDAGSRERTFVRALELFDSAKSNEDYRGAAQLWESLLVDGYQNGAVYYNLGNAYFRAGEYGRAILNYRKALPYRPRDPYLIANLQQAIAAAPGKLGESPKPWWKHVLFWSDWLAYPTKMKFCFTSIAILALVLSAAFGFRKPWLLWLSVAVVLISIIGGLDLLIQYNEVELEKHAVIVAETIARKGTGNSYEAAFDQPLQDGAEFRVLSETAEWTLGRFEGIGDGWVRNEFVAR